MAFIQKRWKKICYNLTLTVDFSYIILDFIVYFTSILLNKKFGFDIISPVYLIINQQTSHLKTKWYKTEIKSTKTAVEIPIK